MLKQKSKKRRQRFIIKEKFLLVRNLLQHKALLVLFGKLCSGVIFWFPEFEWLKTSLRYSIGSRHRDDFNPKPVPRDKSLTRKVLKVLNIINRDWSGHDLLPQLWGTENIAVDLVVRFGKIRLGLVRREVLGLNNSKTFLVRTHLVRTFLVAPSIAINHQGPRFAAQW